MVAVRNQMFIKSMEAANVPLGMPCVQPFFEAHEVLLGNLSLLRSGHVGVLEVPDVLESIKDTGDGLRAIRARILASLDEPTRRAVMEHEWHVSVSIKEIRQQIDGAQAMIADIAEGLLASDWFTGDSIE